MFEVSFGRFAEEGDEAAGDDPGEGDLVVEAQVGGEEDEVGEFVFAQDGERKNLPELVAVDLI